jgi:geranylgeranyl diphosphate synthase type II
MQALSFYQQAIASHLASLQLQKEPTHLYQPIKYILDLGGKRLRPVLTLMAAEIFGATYTQALSAATAVEVFHNFSLVHDDIMDDAPLRRGNQTVHEKWDINTGILSGDAMLILAYQHFEYDVDFETRNNVTISEYLKMIEYKTAVLVGAALKMGAIVAQTSIENQELIYNFGLNLGIAFQLQDDYLDAFGDPETFGKQVGGDIIENKKTYLYLKALEFSNQEEKSQLLTLFTTKPTNIDDKVAVVKDIFIKTNAAMATQKAIEEYTFKAFKTLEKLDISQEKKQILKAFGENLMNRKV